MRELHGLHQQASLAATDLSQTHSQTQGLAMNTIQAIADSGVLQMTVGMTGGGCTLVESSFDIFIQGILGMLAFTTLFVKRYLEKPQRPFTVWAFDTSKQAFAGLTVHWLNIGIAEYLTHEAFGEAKLMSDECDFYFVNFVIDVFVGVTVTFILLEAIEIFAEKYEVTYLRTGDYGNPASPIIFFIQLGVYMGITIVIKAILFAVEIFVREYLDVLGYELFHALDAYPKAKLVFVMVAAPFVLNSLQFWMIDYMLNGYKSDKEADEEGHMQISAKQLSNHEISVKSKEVLAPTVFDDDESTTIGN
eukprot:CAMPEP_0184482070 /NCGR_PEP_ID=MMETSP0113_2-20130426/3640_1 /TAXON_ID=91329 /ORGANISM="Norrisiella sphaerica, Strain BC52" /LENGTH=304 /DNA_ID=CAMNT_0026861595 /DNA_START=40 /DNA_END=954 /DNA_ORIENTATION=-